MWCLQCYIYVSKLLKNIFRTYLKLELTMKLEKYNQNISTMMRFHVRVAIGTREKIPVKSVMSTMVP